MPLDGGASPPARRHTLPAPSLELGLGFNLVLVELFNLDRELSLARPSAVVPCEPFCGLAVSSLLSFPGLGVGSSRRPSLGLVLAGVAALDLMAALDGNQEWRCGWPSAEAVAHVEDSQRDN